MVTSRIWFTAPLAFEGNIRLRQINAASPSCP
jgi:hypothetical protein